MKSLIVAIGLMTLLLTSATMMEHQAEAVGQVRWGRDLDAALTTSKQSGKPVFALFQEVPGCAGCRQFGRDVLSNALIVEAIETEFTPLLIPNNAAGADAQVLQRFGEPAWNYQVVRFLDSSANDLIPRKDQIWTTGPLAQRMIVALGKAGRTPPPYLKLLAAEYSPDLKQAVFAMYCFWTGEMELGKIDGVITTEAGFMAGHEVTRVSYDPEMITLPALIAQAEHVRCANSVWVPEKDLPQATTTRLKVGAISDYKPAPASDQKKQLEGTAAASLRLQGAQATKVNAWIRGDTAKALSFLTPNQQAQLKQH